MISSLPVSMSRSIGVLSVVVLSLGCGSPSGADGGGGNDSGIPQDGGFPDSGLPNDGHDAGAADAGGDAPDAGVVDAGPVYGCATGSQCASGVCLPSGECRTCQSDFECHEGRRCGSGVCAASCATAATCGAGQDCCGGRCVDPQRDPAHCGQCTQACTATQFCGRGACRATDFSQLCQQPLMTLVLDQITEDDTAGLRMVNALVTDCSPAVTSRSAGQDDAGVLRLSDGEPLATGELLVMGGGSFRQRAVRWLETNRQAAVSDTSTSLEAIYSLADGGVVSSVPFSTLSSTRDRVLVQLVRAPSGALVLNAAGFNGSGTLAAAFYFVQTLLPMRATLTTRWYVIDWEDLDVNGPSAGDRYTVIASGS